jgi:hypothetical protein
MQMEKLGRACAACGGGTSREAGVRGGPPVGGTFQFQIFIQTLSPEIWSETISGSEKVLAGKWGSLFLGYLLGKNIGRVVVLISCPPNVGWMQQSPAVRRRAILPVGSTGASWAVKRREFITLLGGAAA